MTTSVRRYRAFISYSHRDKAVAAWLQGALERYHVPAKLVGRDTPVGPVPARLHPLFRDRDELPASADLGSQLMAALENSMFLIVICSPASAASRWVGEEILNFKRMHGEGRVLALICDGEPGSADAECFPVPLQCLIGPDGALSDRRAEPIAADMRPQADGRRLAKMKLIAALTGIPLDDLVQREAARRARRLAAIAIASAIGMVLALGLAFYANTQRIAAVEQRKIAETESAAARATADYLVDTFKLADPATENPRTITAFTILGRSAERARRELAEQPEVQLRLIDTVAQAYLNLGLYDDARAALAGSSDTMRALGSKAARPILTLAQISFYQGDLVRAIGQTRLAEQRLGDGSGNPTEDRQIRVAAAQIRAQALYEKNDLTGALAAYAEALVLLRATPAARPALLAKLLNDRGLLLTGVGRYREAGADLAEAHRRLVALRGANSFDVGQTLYAISNNYYLAGDTARALPIIRQSLMIYRQVLDRENPKIAYALTLKGQILRDLKRPAEAAAVLTEAVAIFRNRYRKPHYMIGISEVYQALAVADTGRTDAALKILDDAKHNYDVGYGEIHANHGDLLVNRATILAKAGRKAEARRACADGVAILDRTMDRADSLFASLKATCAAIGKTGS